MMKPMPDVLEYPKNLILDIANSHRTATPGYLDVDYAIKNFDVNWEFLIEREPDLLTERVQLILNLYYKDKKTLVEIGKIIGVTGTRIKQILEKTILMLARSRYICYIFLGKDDILKANTLKDEYIELLEMYIIKNNEIRRRLRKLDTVKTVDEYVKEANVFDQSIDNLGLNVRVWNILRNAGILSIGDLVDYTRSELESIKSLGRKGIIEIIEQLAVVYGLSLKKEIIKEE